MRSSARFWVAVPFFLAGCAGILGIEDTEEATSSGGNSGSDASTGATGGTGNVDGGSVGGTGGSGGTGGISDASSCDAGSFDVGTVADAKAVQGGSVDVDISVIKNACFDAAIDVSLVTPPVGFSASPLSIAVGQTTGQLQLMVDAAVAPGPVTLNLNATGGGVSRNFDMKLVVSGEPGAVDPSFTTFELPGSGTVKALAVQSDGRILVGINTASGAGWQLKRLQADGAVESGFSPAMPSSGALTDVAVATTGAIALSGQVNAEAGVAIVALNPNGSGNPLYGSNGTYVIPSLTYTEPIFARGVAMQADGKILFAGYRDEGGTTDDPGLLVRMDPANSAPPPPGKVDFGLLWPDSILGVVIPTSALAIVGGTSNGSVFLSAGKLSDGSKDTTFGAANGVTTYAPGQTPNHSVSDGGLGGQGIFLCGSAGTPAGSQPAIFWFDANGKNPTSSLVSPPGAYNYVYRGCAVTPDGKIVAVGSGGTTASGIRTVVSRFNSDGSLDTTFSPGSSPPGHYVFQLGGNTSLQAIAVQPDGRIIVGGSSAQIGAVVLRLFG